MEENQETNGGGENSNQQSSTIEDLTESEVAALDAGKCPDCGGKTFREGPHGGFSVNIMCGACGAKFNVIPGLRGSFGKERIGRPTNPHLISQSAEKPKPTKYGKVPDKLASFLVQFDCADGASVTLDAYPRQALFDRPECAISLPCKDIDAAQALIATLCRSAWNRIEGTKYPEKKLRYERIRKSLLDLIIIGEAVRAHLRPEMLAHENTRALYDDIEDAVREAKTVLIEAFGYKARDFVAAFNTPEADYGSDAESVRLGDAGAPAPGEAFPGAVDDR